MRCFVVVNSENELQDDLYDYIPYGGRGGEDDIYDDLMSVRTRRSKVPVVIVLLVCTNKALALQRMEANAGPCVEARHCSAKFTMTSRGQSQPHQNRLKTVQETRN